MKTWGGLGDHCSSVFGLWYLLSQIILSEPWIWPFISIFKKKKAITIVDIEKPPKSRLMPALSFFNLRFQDWIDTNWMFRSIPFNKQQILTFLMILHSVTSQFYSESCYISIDSNTVKTVVSPLCSAGDTMYKNSLWIFIYGKGLFMHHIEIEWNF